MTYSISSTEYAPLLSESTFFRRFSTLVPGLEQRVYRYRSLPKQTEMETLFLSMTLKQSEETLERLAYESKPELFSSIPNTNDFVFRVLPVYRISDCFKKVIDNKKITKELRKSPYWEMWRENITWILKQKEKLEISESQGQTVTNESALLLTEDGEEPMELSSNPWPVL